MSQALQNQIKRLSERVAELEQKVAELAAREPRKPGRPRKNETE